VATVPGGCWWSTFCGVQPLLRDTGRSRIGGVVREPDGFAEFVGSRSRSLLRTAWLLTGDWGLAEDLVQSALAKSWAKWESIAAGRHEAYVRRVMATTFIAWRRRLWNAEYSTKDLRDELSPDDVYARADARVSLVRALQGLPARQRATIVLRFFDDLSETDTALALGCSIGTVKTHASRGLAALRATPGLEMLAVEGKQ
jgi:RNA polymerase sigma-70 factor (sigma-E family)